MSDIMASLPLSQTISVRSETLRSIYLEHDAFQPDLMDKYLVTGQALATLGRLLDGVSGPHISRAWTLTGPYGSGKSFFGLFILHLASQIAVGHLAVMEKLHAADSLLCAEAERQFGTSSPGWFTIAVTGRKAPLWNCLSEGFVRALALSERTAELASLFDTIVSTDIYDSRRLISVLQELSGRLAEPDLAYKGILLVFDELGKTLEYSAQNPHRSDVYLLQELAEFANRSMDIPFVLVGILHQAFEHYADLLDSTMRREWAKVQGRFEDVAFQEPIHQQLRLLPDAIVHSIPQPVSDQLVSLVRQQARRAVSAGWTPGTLTQEEFLWLCERTYPFHPTTLALLPYVFRRLGQNERSLFSFLASHEPFGFYDFVQSHSLGEFLRPPDIFQYVQANLYSRLAVSGRGRVLSEALERLTSIPDLSDSERDVVRIVALLNWVGETSPLKAREPMIASAYGSDDGDVAEIRSALHDLKKRSVIVYRGFNDTYAIWQGSDVDIEERLEQARRLLTPAFSIADTLQRYLPPRPLVARRHSHQTGTVRVFVLEYLDGQTFRTADLALGAGAAGKVLLCLPSTLTEVDFFAKWASEGDLCQRADLVVGIGGQALRLREQLFELRCLNWVHENTPALAGDAVARRELHMRISNVERLVRKEVENAFSTHQLSRSADSRWFHRGEEIVLAKRQGLSALLSDICDDLYSSTPLIWNELLNRNSLTSQSAAGRNALLEAMCLHSDQPDLGIEGYPPQRSMYESLLKAGGLHREISTQNWALTSPGDNDALRLSPVWEAMAAFIFAAPPEPRPVLDLYRTLAAPPYGLTQGILPVLLCAFACVHRDEVTLYLEGTLVPEAGVADWQLLARRPDLFAIAGYQLNGRRLAILERFGRGLGVKPAILPVTRRLIAQLKALPEYAWRTRRLSPGAVALRYAVDTARSPEQLIFHDLPQALTLPPFSEEEPQSERVECFFQRLNEVLEELITATPRLRLWARDVFLQECGLRADAEGWQSFLLASREMITRVTNAQLTPLLRRAVDTSDPDQALESVLAHVANRPLRTWTDGDADTFVTQARFFGDLFQTERRNGAHFALLSPQQLEEARAVALQLEDLLGSNFAVDAQVLQAAIRLLLKSYEQGDAESGTANPHAVVDTRDV